MFLPKSLLRDSLWAGHSYCFCDWKHMKALGLGRSKNEKAWLYCCWPWETQRSWSLPPNETGTPKLRHFDFQNGFILDSKMDHFDGPFLGSSSVGACFLCNCRKSKLNPRKPDPVNCQRGGTFSEPAGGGTLKWVGSEVLSPPQFIGSSFSRVKFFCDSYRENRPPHNLTLEIETILDFKMKPFWSSKWANFEVPVSFGGRLQLHWVSQGQKQYSQALSFFDLPKPKVFICFQAQQQYSHTFSLFDLWKPMVFIGFQAQNQYSQTFSFFDLQNLGFS